MISNAIARRMRDLEQYAPMLTAPTDLNEFWNRTLERFKDKPLHATSAEEKTPMRTVDVLKVKYEGFDDTPLSGWYIRPAGQDEQRLPCIVMYHGYTGSKGYPEEYAQWAALGYAVFAVDVRGQGGETGNHLPAEFGMSAGWISQGILDKEQFYYLAITIDALKAVQWVAERHDVDRERIAVYGASQGGGLALITAALSDIPAVAVANIPNMCHMDFGILNSESSLKEAAQFVSRHPQHLQQVLQTLSYFDMLNLGERIRIPLLVSCGLKDMVCLPETIFAAYNRIRADKQIAVYPFDGHYVDPYHTRRTMEFLQQHFG
ncbi:acetylxylan esterase [Paenibacillus campi]|uniref:acetylxylan esterase n=1 Tax=Paenibacillus campi TaxID=3106031 RepID=UPI002AFDF6AB|nr:alpha/beta fold hydrolase [Paenibacillus sp. SGZ-1014]